MSSFGVKRKARIIQTYDEDDGDKSSPAAGAAEPQQDTRSAENLPLKFKRKPLKQSSLRRSINIGESEDGGDAEPPSVPAGEDADSVPTVVVRPSLSRPGSVRLKNRVSSSQLSFGPGEEEKTEGDNSLTASAPRKTLSQRTLENNALRTATPSSRLPTRTLGSDDDRPRYSKEYLDELQNSTPNTPQGLANLQIVSDEEMDLDPSELAGAVIVDSRDLAPAVMPSSGGAPVILSETEIQARKARRERLGLEQAALALPDDDEDDADGSGGHFISLQPQSSTAKKKGESRLIAEDEDLGEGYDEFVEDGGLSLGRKAEHAAAARHRAEMAALIDAAEGKEPYGNGADDNDEDLDSSDAERKAAYEAAQTRAGMDGLARPSAGGEGDSGAADVVIPRMRPLPELDESLARLRGLVQGLQDEVARRRARVAEMERERAEILAREAEVQEVLNATGQKYQAAVGGAAPSAAADVAMLVSQSPLRSLPRGLGGELAGKRGLESLGTTPAREEVGLDE